MVDHATITLRCRWGRWRYGICYLYFKRKAIGSVTRFKDRGGIFYRSSSLGGDSRIRWRTEGAARAAVVRLFDTPPDSRNSSFHISGEK